MKSGCKKHAMIIVDKFNRNTTIRINFVTCLNYKQCKINLKYYNYNCDRHQSSLWVSFRRNSRTCEELAIHDNWGT